LLRLPAYNPLTGAPVSVFLEGQNSKSFEYDKNTGNLIEFI